ncbi:FRG domain-containing protein [Spirosoma taeanense]|uniref:FRG domain-containing protein n=1 Tax=Spirosoma taeanense TaxID=2735870 RepID=A0A6M5Y7X4_9BACT|nr:FRG domain-containing protein [Spirosoma taeanense]QJW90437.1 FRG domain-containing protein [Spirosoma taeanense]
MKQTRVTTWSQLMDCLYEEAWMPALQRFRPPFAFRGLPDASYTLNTSLMRLSDNCAPIEGHLLRNFKKYALRNVVERDSFWYWLSVAQHHGLPTRLMDWTFSPYVALHFVTASTQRYDRDGVVWCLDYKKMHQQLPDALRGLLEKEGADVFTIDMLSHIHSLREFDDQAEHPFALLIEPPSIDDRIVNQYALFSVISSPTVGMNSWLEERPDVYRQIIIAKELKWEIRDKLDQANINERVLFPGLDGLSLWLRRQYVQPSSDSDIPSNLLMN